MLGFFPKSTVSIPSFPDEQWSITRVGRGKSSNSINYQFQALIPKNSKVVIGNLVSVTGEDYFVTTLEKSFVNTVCQLRKTNATIDIVRVTKHYTATKVNDYDYEAPLFTSVTAFYEDVNAKLAMYDAGLLSTSTRRFLVPLLSVKLLDRIKHNNENLRVDGINTSSYPGLLWIQCSVDTRATKVI